MSPSSLKRAVIGFLIAGVTIFSSATLPAAEMLYGISNGTGIPENNLIYQIDPATGNLSNLVQVTLAGYTVGRVQSLVARPSDGVLFAVLQTQDPNGPRRLVTINPTTGVCTDIGAFTEQIASLAFRASGTLYAASGTLGTNPKSLFTINTTTAEETLLFALVNGDGSETIVFHPNGLLYHSAGGTPGASPAVFESINVDTQTVTPINSASVPECFAMGYSPGTGNLFGSDYNSDLYTVDIATGTRTFVGAMADQLPVSGMIAARNRGLAFAVSQVCSAPPGGMVSWWPADNTAADIQGHHDGSWQGTAAYGGGEVGTAFSFNGDPANYVLVQPDTSLDLTVFTVDAWVYPTAVAPAQWILNKGAQATLANYDLALTDTNRAEINFDAPTVGHQSVDSTDPIPLNAWTHITGTYDGTTLKLYINGVPNNSQVFGTTPSATGQPITIGVRNVSPVQYPFNGLIDEVEVFDHALTDAQVLAIYNAGTAGKCRSCATPPLNMLAWWPGDANASDLQGNHNGTLMNGATFGTGEVSQAFSLDGVDDYVDVGDVDLPATFTIDAWVDPTTVTSDPNSHTIISKTDNALFSYYLAIGDGFLFLRVEDSIGNATVYRTLDAVVPAGVWSHVGVTYDGSAGAGEKIKFYINGINDTAIPIGGDDSGGTPRNSSVPAAIGRVGSFAGAYFSGQIDEVELFSRVLSLGEIQAIYDAGSFGKCKPPPVVQFSSGTYTVSEGDGNATLTVTRTGDLSGTSTVQYATANGSANAGSDYTTTSGTLTFAPGVVSQDILVPITDDSTYEASEDFTVTLSAPSTGTTIGTPDSATVTITDDDPVPTISIDDVAHAEGNSGTTSYDFTVSLSNPSSQTITVDYATADGSATEPSDYTASSTTHFTFAPGETSKPVTVLVNGDTVNVPDETFTVHLSNASAGATISDADG